MIKKIRLYIFKIFYHLFFYVLNYIKKYFKLNNNKEIKKFILKNN
jgi:hypothetical protein